MIENYVDRTVDYLVFNTSTPQRMSPVTVSLTHNGTAGYLCTGVQKLAQRTLLALLTEAGSVWFRPDYGTDFMRDARQGRWRTSADVRLSFYASKVALMRQLREFETEATPADERIDSVELLGVSFLNSVPQVNLELRTAAGDSYTFIAPISVRTR